MTGSPPISGMKSDYNAGYRFSFLENRTLEAEGSIPFSSTETGRRFAGMRNGVLLPDRVGPKARSRSPPDVER